jgi:GT2 family glycosyltransferase
MSSKVLVSIVTYNSDTHLKACLESLQKQSYRNFEIRLFDNASKDSTAGIIKEYRHLLESVHFSDQNLGFCTAHNRIIDSASSDYVLVLNPDVILDSHFLKIMISAMDNDPGAGSATGKLYRQQWTPTNPPKNPEAPPQIVREMKLDSTGIYFTRNQRHLDRGSGEKDVGQYNHREYVFGASGAAALYRRSMLVDIRYEKEYFDENFFAYREDADLAWRAQWMGWRCLYIPEAIGWHERNVLPERRPALPDSINMHSFKNRFLLRIKNMDAGTYVRNFVPITFRDVTAIVYVLLVEWSSLSGLPLLIHAIPKTFAIRQDLKKRRRIPTGEIRRWLTGCQSIPL